MQLALVGKTPSPFQRKPDMIWALEKQGTFLISDRWKMFQLDTSGDLNLLWDTVDKDNSVQVQNVYDDRLADPFYDEIREVGYLGFKLFSKPEYDDIFKNIPLIHRRIPLFTYDRSIVDLQEKVLYLLQIDEGKIIELAKTKTKGKAKTAAMLRPYHNSLVYGTNYGELYMQPFDQGKFGKTTKVDQLPNVCYQIAFSPDGKRMFVVGLGYLKIYDFDGSQFSAAFSQATAARSFELVNDYLILNKGMHGIDVIQVADKPERSSSLDLPFSIDQMVYLASNRTFLVTSASSNDLYFLRWTV